MDSTIQSLWQHSEAVPYKNDKTKTGALLSNTRVGVEVEVEQMQRMISVPGWRCTTDGSLRENGVEFVFKGPIGGAGACRRLVALDKALTSIPQKNFSARTSVHVHVDVRDMTWNELLNLVILYAMVEPYLFSVCGQERDESIYSLSLYRGQDQVSKLINLIENGPEFLTSRNWTKYSSVNLLSVINFGSLEFRGHRGTCDSSTLINWINHLLSLKMWVQMYSNNLSDLPKLLSTSGHIAMLREVFGDKLLVPNIKAANRVRSKIYEGVWVAEDIIHHTKMNTTHRNLIESLQGGNQLDKIKDKLCAV